MGSQLRTSIVLCLKQILCDYISALQTETDRGIMVIIIDIYILNVAALDETIIPSCLHFSMQNIEQSRGLGRASRWSNVNVNQ